MENYIRDLLKEKDRVIIPNLGGFLKSKGEFNSLIFNEFIKFNDGQLINYVARRENIGIDEASGKVDDFVESVKAKLNKGKKISIDGVGTLFTGERARLRFIAESDDKKEPTSEKNADLSESSSAKETQTDKKPIVTSDFKKEERSPLKDKKTPVREPAEAEKKEAEGEFVEKTQSPDDTGDSLADKPPVPAPDEKEEKTASVTEVSEKEKPKPPAASGGKKQEQNKEDKISQKDPRGLPPEGNGNNKKKKRSPLLWLIPLIIIIALGIWVILDHDNMRGYFHMNSEEVADTEPAELVETGQQELKGEKEEIPAASREPDQQENARETEEESTALKQEVSQEAIEEPEIEQQEQTEVPPETISPAKKYHLIAGVFSDWENATELVDKLKDEGFYADIVAVIKGRYYVSYNSFKKKSDARYEWQRLLDKGYDAWLYYY